jgi:hypothetical protein
VLFCYPAVVKAGLVPSNDHCTNSIAVDVPSSTSGTTNDAINDFLPACGGASSQDTPGVWYTVTGTGNTITASTCTGTSFDTELSVWCGDCPEPPSSNCCFANASPGCDDTTCQDTICGFDPFCCSNAWDSRCADEALNSCPSLCTAASVPTCVGGNDDACESQSEVSWCSKAGATYRILVYGFEDTGDFDLSLTDDGQPCETGPQCAPIGACCSADVCSLVTADNCAAQSGTYQGDGTTCQDVTCGGPGAGAEGEGFAASGSCTSIAGAAPVQLGTAMANMLIPLVPALAVGFGALRRKKKGQK